MSIRQMERLLYLNKMDSAHKEDSFYDESAAAKSHKDRDVNLEDLMRVSMVSNSKRTPGDDKSLELPSGAQALTKLMKRTNEIICDESLEIKFGDCSAVSEPFDESKSVEADFTDCSMVLRKRTSWQQVASAEGNSLEEEMQGIIFG